MRIIEKGILEMTAQEMRQCKSLSLRYNGLMSEDLVDWKAYESRPNRAKRKSRVWMIYDGDRLLSWALCTPRWMGRGYDAQFYTRRSERGKGYGSILMDLVLDYCPNPHVFPHDNLSGAFFKKARPSLHIDKTDTKWLD